MPLPSHDSPLARLRLGFVGTGGTLIPHLSVDGMTDAGPNLSHWPGNRTPPQWKADLSTEIAFRFVRDTAYAQRQFLGDARLVVNDHYDTDGFCSLLTILRPDVAAAREELLISAAATGDFAKWHTWRGFAIDRIVRDIASPRSPVRNVFTGIADPEDLSLRRYEWLIENAESVLDHPGGYHSIYADEMARVEREIETCLRGAVTRMPFAELDIGVLISERPLHRMTLNTLAGGYRVLHIERRAGDEYYRYHDRTESWFELATIRTLPRRDLRLLAERLDQLEPERDGARWCADPPDEPIPELWFGVPSKQAYGEVTRELRPSRLRREQVVDELLAFFDWSDQ